MNNGLFDIRGEKYASVTCANVTLYDLVCGSPVIHFDTLKMSNLEGTAEITKINGGQGNAVLAAISHTKALTVSMEEALVTMSYLAVITGGEVVTADATHKIVIKTNEEITATETGLSLSHALPAEGTLWLAESVNGVISERKARFDAPAGSAVQDIALNASTWSPSSYTLTAGTTYRVFYEYELGDGDVARELTVFADKFSKTYKFVGDTVLYNTRTGRNEAFQIEIPRLKLDDAYTLTFDAAGEAATFNLNGEALADDSKRLIIFRLYNEDEGSDADGCILEGSSI